MFFLILRLITAHLQAFAACVKAFPPSLCLLIIMLSSAHHHDLLTSACSLSPCTGPLWLSWLWLFSSSPSSSSSVMEICGSSSGWSCRGRCCPGTSASSSSSSCHLMSARYETTAGFFFLVVTCLNLDLENNEQDLTIRFVAFCCLI